MTKISQNHCIKSLTNFTIYLKKQKYFQRTQTHMCHPVFLSAAVATPHCYDLSLALYMTRFGCRSFQKATREERAFPESLAEKGASFAQYWANLDRENVGKRAREKEEDGAKRASENDAQEGEGEFVGRRGGRQTTPQKFYALSLQMAVPSEVLKNGACNFHRNSIQMQIGFLIVVQTVMCQTISY